MKANVRLYLILPIDAFPDQHTASNLYLNGENPFEFAEKGHSHEINGGEKHRLQQTPQVGDEIVVEMNSGTLTVTVKQAKKVIHEDVDTGESETRHYRLKVEGSYEGAYAAIAGGVCAWVRWEHLSLRNVETSLFPATMSGSIYKALRRVMLDNGNGRLRRSIRDVNILLKEYRDEHGDERDLEAEARVINKIKDKKKGSGSTRYRT